MLSESNELAEEEKQHSNGAELLLNNDDDDDDDDGYDAETSTTDEEISRSEVFYEAKDWTVSVLKQYSDAETILVHPEYQREYVWDNKPTLKSRLIESLLMNIPIPPLYLGKLRGGKYEVIDGQQRLTTILNFIDKDKTFPLRKLTKLKHLNGKKYQDLDEPDKLQITSSATMRTIVIDASRDDDLRYQIFERLNRGSVQLNEQEIRHCIYRGPFNTMLNRLTDDSNWRKIVGSDKKMERYKEQEHILRFLALAKQLDSYKSSLKLFMNNFMNQHKDLPEDAITLKEFEQLFHQTMQNIYDVFGEKSARLYTPTKEQEREKEGAWEPDFSILALDVQASALLGHNRTDIQAISDQIREAYLFYLLADQNIQAAISQHTSSKQNVKLRWTGFKAEVNNLLMSASKNPRFFSPQFRERLYDENPYCKLCKNKIHALEDSTVDHITAWSNGGKTVAENGQLAHRLCNAQKNKKPSYE